VEDDLGLVLGGDAGQVLALGLGDAQALVGVLDRVGQVFPVVDLVLGGLDVVVDVVEVEVGHAVGEPRQHRLLLERFSALSRKSSIHLSSFLMADISRTIASLMPFLGLKTGKVERCPLPHRPPTTLSITRHGDTRVDPYYWLMDRETRRSSPTCARRTTS
jgi:hypothetical protein